MTNRKPTLLALTVVGILACGESRSLVGENNSDGAAGSGGNAASSGAGGTVTNSATTSNAGALGSGGTTTSGGALGSGGAIGSGGVLKSGGSTSSGGASASTGGLAAGGSGGASGGTSGLGGTSGSAGTGGRGVSDAGPDGQPDALMSSDAQALAELCIATGGKVETKDCCLTASPFPSSCLGGACGCSPSNSQPLTVCTCPTSTCFQPTTGCAPWDSGVGGHGGSGGAGGGGGSGGSDAGSDTYVCTITDVYCAWGQILDSHGCWVCAPAPSDGGTPDVLLLSPDAQALALLCSSTGGQVKSQSCCGTVSDFPDSCMGGACGCAPQSSHTVTICECQTGSCFTPATGCGPRSSGVGSTGATDGGSCTAEPGLDTSYCVGTNPSHYYACVGTVPSDPCVQVSTGDLTNGFCCP